MRVHYTGWTTDGKSSTARITCGQPVEFPLDQVIPGWTEGLQLMVVGEKRRFWIPGKLAYDAPIPGLASPKGMLVFEIDCSDRLDGRRLPRTSGNAQNDRNDELDGELRTGSR